VSEIRTDWTRADVTALYEMPLMELLASAAAVHRAHHDPTEVQLCQLLSIKTGGCPEDCSYCSQSVHNESPIKVEPLMDVDEVAAVARRAKRNGVTRLCMGAAWREVKDNAQFDRVVEMVRAVHDEGVEVCVTLGMLDADQARRLAEAGLYAYNHNLDTSEEFYPEIISTRTYQDRLDTIAAVRTTDVTVCCGGIIGMGEQDSDRIGLLHRLATLDPHPESVPINVLAKFDGSRLAGAPDVDALETIRMVALARILMPESAVRLSAGRDKMSVAEQALCFFAGANSIFSSERNMMLTSVSPCADHASDKAMLAALGLRPSATVREVTADTVSA
jgi:biotin synthase